VKIYQTGWAFFAEVGLRPDMKKFPAPLAPIDDKPPFTVIQRIDARRSGRLLVRGVSVDDGAVRMVRVNGHPARPLADDYSRWEVEIDIDCTMSGVMTLTAAAEDDAGHVEKIPHQTGISVR
jgi:hypothetical protein